MTEPTATRPYMPGYGIQPATAGSGLLPWSWAEQRLIRSHDFWLATVTPDGAPHLMPVWAVWHTGALWFSSSNGSRKARNLAGQPRCSLATDDPLEPVVVQGRAERVTEPAALAAMLARGERQVRHQLRPGHGGPRVEQRAAPAPGVGVRARLAGLHRLPYPVHVPRRYAVTGSFRLPLGSRAELQAHRLRITH